MSKTRKTDRSRQELRRKDAIDPIDASLKRVFDATLEEPLPRQLAELLDRLKKAGA